MCYVVLIISFVKITMLMKPTPNLKIKRSIGAPFIVVLKLFQRNYSCGSSMGLDKEFYIFLFHRWLRKNVIHFQHSHITNHVKFANLRNRKIFRNYSHENNSNEYTIHSPGTTIVNRPWLPTPVELKPISSVWINREMSENRTYHSVLTCIMILETVLPQILSPEPPCSGPMNGFQYDFPDLTYKSFLSKRCCNDVKGTTNR